MSGGKVEDLSLQKLKERKFQLKSGVEITFKKYRRTIRNQLDSSFPPMPITTWVVEYFTIKISILPNGGCHTAPIQGSFPCNTAARGARKLRLVLAREMSDGMAEVDDAMRGLKPRPDPTPPSSGGRTIRK